MNAARGMRVAALATGLLAVGAVAWEGGNVPNAIAQSEDRPSPGARGELPLVRRVFVPNDRLEGWLNGDWQPVVLSELERQLDAARAVQRERPAAFIEKAEYTAALIEAEFKNARLEWSVRQPDSRLSLLSVGRLNLNVSQLGWSDSDSKQPPSPALWGVGSAGPSGIVVNRSRGKLVADWSLPGRRLAASTEFDFELPPAALSQMLLRIPAGQLLTSTVGELSGPAASSEPGWNEWRLNLGSQTSCRLRIAPPPEANAARPLVLVRSNLNYFVRSEAVRVLADFELDVLESDLRELRVLVDPEVQVTAVEYGDDGAVAWESTPAPAGQEVIVRLPDTLTGAGHTLQVQGIAQVKQFAAWTLPRIRLQNSVEVAGRATLRLQSSFLTADVKTDGYRQLELTADENDGEVLVFRRIREDGTITVVPTDSKADLTCHAVTLIQPERHQWSMVSQWDFRAAAGSTFSASCAVSGAWEIIDVRLPSGGRTGELSGWEVRETEPGRRTLHLYFLNSIKSDRPQRVRISARRLPPGTGESAVVPPLTPLDVNDCEQILLVATGSEWRPVVSVTDGIEPIEIRDLADETRELDFLGARLADSRTRSVAFKTIGPAAQGELHVERIEPLRDPDGDPSSLSHDQRPDPAPQSPNRGPAESVVSPVALAVTARVTGLASGFDHYLAEYRIAKLAEGASFGWTLPEPAEVIGVTLGDRRIIPVVHGTTYRISTPPDASKEGEPPADVTSLAVEYRIPASTHLGPNGRALILPAADQPVRRFDLTLVLPNGLRLDGQPVGLSPASFQDQTNWRRRLLGPFSRAEGRPIFNPFGTESWSMLWQGDSDDEQKVEQVWRGAAASLPAAVRIVIWNAIEVTWLTWVVLLFCLLGGSLARLARLPHRRQVAIAGVVLACLGSLLLPPVFAELSGSALTALILVVLMPQRLFKFNFGSRRRDTSQVPVGSTQSFVPIASLLLAFAGMGMGLAVQAQVESTTAAPARTVARMDPRQIVDVLIPVGTDRKPVGKIPVAYVPTEFLARMKRMAAPTDLPAYLIADCSYDGRLDESNRFFVSARFDVHVLATESLVPVHLPLGIVNLGGADACLVNGRPHPVVAGPDGRGLIVDLQGANPLPGVPAVPEQESPTENSDSDGGTASARADEPFPVQSYSIELHLSPAVDGGRAGVSSSTLTVPRGCQTRATFSSSIASPSLGIFPAGAGPSASRVVSRAPGNVAARPGPTNQLSFFWSATADLHSRAPAEAQVSVSCLADATPALIQMRYHLAYRVQAGQIDSLVWHVPAGYVLESVQAPQLAGYRFVSEANGARRMLIEFSRPQVGDFSLAATFAVAVDRFEKRIPLTLLDPLRGEDSAARQLSLRFHQIALRYPSDFLASVSAAATEQPFKPRPVDDFLKEWNAAGARPQQAFDLERRFALNLILESQPSVPAVRGSSIARFHPGHLDWTYTAEVAQSAIPQFLYRLHVDPRLRIRSISVQEDGAERLLRWSQLRETVVLFLNDRATRAQTVRVNATVPVAAAQVFELPRIRFAGATPGLERVTVYRDADVAVRLANPEDFPQPESGGVGPDARGDRLVGRIDVLPEQSSLRVEVEPVLPIVAAEVATVLEARGNAWQFTTGVEFQVTSGRVNEFTIEIPEAVAARIETRSVPASHVSTRPAAEGRVSLAFHPDEAALTRFVAILSNAADVSGSSWKIPSIRLPGAEQMATTLLTPRGAFEPALGAPGAVAVPIPDWVKGFAPATTNAARWNSYNWPAEANVSELRRTRNDSSRTVASAARIDAWLEMNGRIAGTLGLNIAGNSGSEVELAWPETARLTALFVGDAFQSLPIPKSGRLSIPMPPGTAQCLVWLSWDDAQSSPPAFSGAPAARLPWPWQIPVENCRVNVHPPQHFVVDAALPLVLAEADFQPGLVPPVYANPDVAENVSLTVSPVPEPGKLFDLGPSLRLTNERPEKLGLSLGAVLLLTLLSWKTAPFWSWLARHETTAWLVIAAVWWLCLEPSGLGPAIAAWAIFASIRRNHVAVSEVASFSTPHLQPRS